MARSASKDAFCQSCKAMRSHNRSCGAPGGGIGSQATPNVHLCPCHGLGQFWLFLSVTEQSAWLPGSQVPWMPLYMTLVILQEVFKNQLFQLAANFVHAMLAIRLVFFWCKSGTSGTNLMATITGL